MLFVDEDRAFRFILVGSVSGPFSLFNCGSGRFVCMLGFEEFPDARL